MSVDLGTARGQIEIDSSGVEQGVKKAQSALGIFSDRGVAALAAVTVGVGAAKLAFDTVSKAVGKAQDVVEGAWRTIEQGAALDMMRTRFDRLSESIDTTGDALLTRLRAGTNGMMTDAQLVASASDIMSLGLGKTEDQTVRLATVVSKLGWDMQTVIMTFANNSKMRLDALGLSVEDVTQRAKELEKQGYSTDAAFDMAVIEAGEAKIELLGDASQTTAGKIQQLKAMLGNVRDAFAEAFSGEVVAQIDKVSESTAQLSKDLEYAAVGAGKLGGSLTRPFFNVAVGLGKLEEIRALGQEYQALGGDLDALRQKYYALFSGRLRGDEAELATEALRAEVAALEAAQARREAYNKTIEAGSEIEQKAADEADRRARAATRAQDDQAEAAAKYERILREAGDATYQVNRQLEAYYYRGTVAANTSRKIAEETGYTTYELAQMGMTAEEAMEQAAAAAEEAASRAAAAFASVQADYVTELPQADEPLVTPERTVTVRTQVSGPTEEQAALVERYQSELEKLHETYTELTNGVGTFGMKQEDLDAKIAETAGEIAHYEGLLAGIPPVVEDVSTSHQGLKVNVDAVHQGIYDQLVQMGAAPEIIAAYAQATGIMSEAQATAALQAAAVKVKIDELAVAIAAGMPIDQALADLDAFITKIEQGVEPAAQTLATDVPQRVVEMKDQMSADALEAGNVVPENIAQGINDSLETATTASTDAATAIVDAAKGAFGVESPSTVFADIGGELMAGLSDGAKDGQGEVTSTMRRIGDAVIRAWDSTIAAADNIGVSIMDGIIAGLEAKRGELIAKMEEIAIEAYNRAMHILGAASPSKVFMNLGEAIITGIIAGLNAQEDKLYDKLIDIAGRLQQIGEGMFTFQADALEVNVADVDEQLQAALDGLRSAYGDIMIDNLVAMSPAERAYFLRTLRGWGPGQNEIVAQQLQAAVVLADQRNALEQEYVRQQEELAKLEEQRSRLNFLQMQVDLLKLIRDNKLSTDILDGLTLGLDANITDVIAAMTEAVRQIIERTSDELEIASPSGVFRRIGGQIMAGLALGVERASGQPVAALAETYDSMRAIGERVRLAGLDSNDLAAQWLRGANVQATAASASDLRQYVTVYGGYNVNLEGAASADPLRDLYWNGLAYQGG